MFDLQNYETKRTLNISKSNRRQVTNIMSKDLPLDVKKSLKIRKLMKENKRSRRYNRIFLVLSRILRNWMVHIEVTVREQAIRRTCLVST